MCAYKFRVGKSDTMRQLKRLSCRLENNINMDLREMVWSNGLDSSGSGYRPVAGSSEHRTEYSGSVNTGNFLRC
jgi:hypothetical protein